MKPLAGPDESLYGGAKVVALDSFRPRASLSPLRQAEAYWAALRRDGAVPKRSAIDPRGLSNLLQYAFILERVAPGVARFRLAGQHLTQVMGMEVSGLPLTTLFQSAARQTVSDHLIRLFDDPAIVELALSGQRRFGRNTPTIRMILLPLSSECGSVDRALGVLVSEDPTTKEVGKLSIETAHHRVIDVASEAGWRTGASAPQRQAERSLFRLVLVSET
ncbi:MAG: PAS domain-containing protein [Paracoccaceae bacterium]